MGHECVLECPTAHHSKENKSAGKLAVWFLGSCPVLSVNWKCKDGDVRREERSKRIEEERKGEERGREAEEGRGKERRGKQKGRKTTRDSGTNLNNFQILVSLYKQLLHTFLQCY